MIGNIIRYFWFPIVVIGALTIDAFRAARRLNQLAASDQGVGKSPVSGHTRPPRPGAPRALLAVCVFAFIVLMQYSPRLALVQAATSDYVVVATIAAAIVVAMVRLRQALRLSARPPLPTLALWFVVAVTGVSGVLLMANALLDRGPVREFSTVVASSHCYRRSYEITVKGAPALPVAGDTMRVNVRSNVCRDVRDGDTVVVVIGPGYLGRAWVQAARPLQASRQ